MVIEDIEASKDEILSVTNVEDVTVCQLTVISLQLFVLFLKLSNP